MLEKEPDYLSKLPTLEKQPTILRPVLFGLGILILFFGTFSLWSLISPLDSAAIAQGKITVETNRKTIQHLEGGIIKKIYIRDGSKVKKGDTLIVLDDTQPRASLDLLRGQANELLATEARLLAEQENAKKITFPKRLLKDAKLAKVKKILDGQQKLFEANEKTYYGQIKILGQRETELEKEIESIDAQVKSETEQLKYIKEEVVAVEYLEKRKLIEKPRLLALKREAARLSGNRGEHLGLIAKAHQKIGETKQQALTLSHTRSKEIATQLRETQTRLADVLEREKAAEDVLKRTTIIAPQAGTIVGLQKHTQAGVITPGQDVLDLIPSQDELIIEARINPLDIDVVHEGLIAKVQLTAFKTRSTPTLNGVVDRVSADSFTDKQTGENYYLAQVKIPKKELKRIKHVSLYPGMPVQVMIITDKRTPFAYFITPIKESFHRAFREQ